MTDRSQESVESAASAEADPASGPEPVRPDGGQHTSEPPVSSDDSVGIIERLPGGSAAATLWRGLADRYEPYLTLEKDDKETIKRWGLGSIISHWVLVALMIVVAGTGFLFWSGWYGPLNIGIWDGYQVSFYLHTYGGVMLAVIALIVFPMYHKFADGHNLLVSPSQIKEEIVIALSFLGLMEYIPGYKNARRTYDEDEEEWVGYHPMQTVFWYLTWFFVVVLTLTGFALWTALATDPAWWIAALGFMDGWVTYETMLRLHLIATFWVLAAIGIHAYFAVMPSNWDFLRSMVVGTVEGWRVDEATRPDNDESIGSEATESDTEPNSAEGQDDD